MLPLQQDDPPETEDTTRPALSATSSPPKHDIPAAVQAMLAKTVGKLPTLTESSLQQGIPVLFWLAQMETACKACNFPVAYIPAIASTHVPPEVAQLVQNIMEWQQFKRNLRFRYCPDPLVIMHALEFLASTDQDGLDTINKFDSLFEVFEMCGIPEANHLTLLRNLITFSKLCPATQEALRPKFQLDMTVHDFHNKILQYDSAERVLPAVSSSRVSLHNVHVGSSVGSRTGPGDPWFAHRTGPTQDEVNEVHRLNNVNLLDSKFELTTEDLQDLFLHEIHSLRAGNAHDSAVKALLKVPKYLRQTRSELKQCYLCGFPMGKPASHSWRHCPDITKILADNN